MTRVLVSASARWSYVPVGLVFLVLRLGGEDSKNVENADEVLRYGFTNAGDGASVLPDCGDVAQIDTLVMGSSN